MISAIFGTISAKWGMDMLSEGNTTVDRSGRELLEHGTVTFPIACYYDDLRACGVVCHWHEELEAALVSEGSVAVTIGSRTRTLQAGEGFFVNTGVLHAVCAAGEGPSRLHSLVFHPRLVGGSPDSIFYKEYLLPLMHSPERTNFCLRRSDPVEARALDAIERTWQACSEEPRYYPFLVRAGLSELVALLLDHRQDLPPAQGDSRAARDNARVKTMLAYIHRHFAEPLTVAQIARSAAISPSECLRCFRRSIGQTPVQYLRECRLRRAGELLAGTALPVARIAADCGFDDVSYFTRTFRAWKHTTPTAYRRGASEQK